MSESLHIPQIEYTPEGVLLVRSGLTEGSSLAGQPEEIEKLTNYRLEALNYLEEQGAIVEHEGDRYKLAIDVKDQLEYSLADPSDWSLSTFVGKFARLLPYGPLDNIDRVINIDGLHKTGIQAGVYPQYQKWMNAHGLNEENARATLEAMAIPFGEDYEKEVKKGFSFGYYQNGEAANSSGLIVCVRHEDFGVVIEDSEKQEIKSGRVNWGWTELTTLGACACLGVNGNDREFVPIWDNTKKLYEMTPHNVDTVRQSFSLLLGLGSLAYAATRYEGDEDILDSVAWKAE